MKSNSMRWEKERLTELTLKYISGGITVEEAAELEQWLEDQPMNRARFEERIAEGNILAGIAVLRAAKESKEQARSRMVWGRRIFPWRQMVAAAILIVVLAGGVILVLKGKGRSESASTSKVVVDLPPGGNKALLTLANGSSIVLDTANEGLIAKQGHSAIVKTDNGQLIYKQGNATAEIGYNMISTPRGGQYNVLLPDGTKVWLNASSSIKFPTMFTGSRREVEMAGEIYVEVAHHAGQPFVVRMVGGREIEDIGTHFNVNAYNDEPEMRATLLEGAVKVAGVTLSPGQQVRIDPNGKPEVINDANVEQAIAWKNGLFEFNGADIETVMRAMGRWYDVTINYQAGKDSHRFTGQISRAAKASEALEILATSGYHFKIEGKVVTVLP